MAAGRLQWPGGFPRRLLATLLVALLGTLPTGCQTPTAPGESPAYDPTRLTDGRIYRWGLGATVAIYADTTGQGMLGVDVTSAVERGLAGWRATWRYDELRPAIVHSAAAADVIVQLHGAPPLVSLDACATSISISAGRTVLCAAGDTARTLPLLSAGAPGRVKVAIEVDVGSAGAAAVDALIAHELGHALGIGGHSAEPADLMYAAPTAIRPTPRDAATLRFVLHQPVALRL